MTRVVVNLCTFNRPDRLKLLFNALDRQDLGGCPDESVSVVLVDNSPERTAEALARDYQAHGRFDLRFVSEPRKGLTHARNAALRMSVDDADYIAFIDDDEVPSTGWLADLVGTAEANEDAAAVVGPVLPIFETSAPIWAIDEPSYCKRLPVNGEGVEDGYTCNALVRTSFIRKLRLEFDPRFNEMGGEDTIFFRRILDAGGTIAWAEKALVLEWIPPQRVQIGWLLQRWYRTGGVEAYLTPRPANSGIGRARNLARGLLRIGAGSVLAVAMLPVGGRSFKASLSAVRTVCRGAGLVGSALGHKHLEYSSPGYS